MIIKKKLFVKLMWSCEKKKKKKKEKQYFLYLAQIIVPYFYVAKMGERLNVKIRYLLFLQFLGTLQIAFHLHLNAQVGVQTQKCGTCNTFVDQKQYDNVGFTNTSFLFHGII
eukprot:TRINITY_DN10119_c0_g1_i10.p6 TRINITY_DN10119_c0_g1~~TRINITY_DN10119_c0_g1_i10.p6  ORF type:complete len:112 (+),score=8.56 TRINITY_DN10119_c0_g1_i10:846-1181(+)